MLYFLGLITILALVFFTFSGMDLNANFLDDLKGKIDSFIFPKTDKEITIENIKSKNGILEKFFSQETATKILNSKDLTPNQKEEYKAATQAFKENKDLVTKLQTLVEGDKGVIKTILNKIVDKTLNSGQVKLDPTAIPPQCRLECN